MLRQTLRQIMYNLGWSILAYVACQILGTELKLSSANMIYAFGSLLLAYAIWIAVAVFLILMGRWWINLNR